MIKDHPWFGSGFGTSLTDDDLVRQLVRCTRTLIRGVIREHGNSYLAIAEWAGLLGVVPFYFLIGMMAINVRQAFSAVRRSGDAFSPAMPAAAIVAAGLIHAAFEDWMFAVGYYLCVFFWAIAFILVDVMPEPVGAAVAAADPIVISMAEPQPGRSFRSMIRSVLERPGGERGRGSYLPLQRTAATLGHAGGANDCWRCSRS